MRNRSDKEKNDIISSEGEIPDFEKWSSSDDDNTRPVSGSQTLPVSTAQKRSIKGKVTEKASVDKQLQLPSVPIGLWRKQVTPRQPTAISIPMAAGIYSPFT